MAIEGTDKPELYRQQRAFGPAGGPSGYSIPVPPGKYAVHLHFAQLSPEPRAGVRVFHVYVDGALVRPHYDPFSSSEGFARADIQSFPGLEVMDGILDITLESVTGGCVIAAIEIERIDDRS